MRWLRTSWQSLRQAKLNRSLAGPLTLAAKAHAFLRGRGYVTPQDVKSIGLDVLRHRITLTYEAEAEEKTSEDKIGRAHV